VDETAVLTYLLITISVPDNGLCTVCAPGISKNFNKRLRVYFVRQLVIFD